MFIHKKSSFFAGLKAVNACLSSSDNIGKLRDKVQNNFYREMAVIHPEHGCVARFRFYCGTSKVYCLALLGSGEQHGSGYGSAGGYGYCKASSAMASALKLAGVDMSENISGKGEMAMRDAAFAVGQMLTGKRKFYIHEAHS